MLSMFGLYLLNLVRIFSQKQLARYLCYCVGHRPKAYRHSVTIDVGLFSTGCLIGIVWPSNHIWMCEGWRLMAISIRRHRSNQVSLTLALVRTDADLTNEYKDEATEVFYHATTYEGRSRKCDVWVLGACCTDPVHITIVRSFGEALTKCG